MRSLLTAALMTAVTLTSVSFVAAQTGPTGPNSQPGAAAPAGQGITETDLLNALRSIDPNVKMERIQDGKATRFDLKVQRNGWNFEIIMILEQDYLKIISPLGSPISNVQSLPAQALAQLLAENWKTVSEGKFSFIQVQDGRMLLVYSVVLPRGMVNAGNAGSTINSFCELVQKSYPVWNAVVSAAR
jgi:hypothetical protein